MMTLTSGNYYTPEANREYWSVSLFKAFDRCEAAGLAAVRGQYERPETDALLIGSYVDAYFTGELVEFYEKYEDRMFKKNGELYAKYEHANKIINTVECQPLMMDFLQGEYQKIFTADLFGVPWKIKTDVYKWADKIVELVTGEVLPFYIAAVTKEPVPDVDVIQLPQSVLDTALKVVEAKIDRFDLVKMGEIPPERCGTCEYCRKTKILTEPSVFEPLEV